jgi:hypothetical protein
MYIVYEGLTHALQRVESKIIRGLMYKPKDPVLLAKKELLNSIKKPEDLYELRGKLLAQHAIAVGFRSSKEEIELIEAKISVLDEVEG